MNVNWLARMVVTAGLLLGVGPGAQARPVGDSPLSYTAPEPSRVGDYQTLNYKGHVCAVRRADLPMAVYSHDPQMEPILREAARTWNEAGQRMGGIQFIEVLDHQAPGAIGVDWTGRGVPVGTAAMTFMQTSSSGICMTRVSMRLRPDTPVAKMIEVLSHELGHTLGLDHSEHLGDLMYRSTRPQGGRAPMLSARDLQMLQWLYSQSDALPIFARR